MSNIDDLTIKMNDLFYPEVSSGDVAWLENYEFEFNGSEWVATGNSIPQAEEVIFTPPIPAEANT